MADKQINELPAVPQLTNDSLIPIYVPGSSAPAQSMNGKQFGDFAREAAAQYVQRAVDAADAAETALQGAETARAGAEAARDSIVVDQQKLAQAVAQAEESEKNAANSANDSKESAENAEYYAGLAQAEADRATIPAVDGVYNVILQDRVTGSRHALIVEEGCLKLLRVADSLDATTLTLIDPTTGTAYAVVIDSGKLALEEV